MLALSRIIHLLLKVLINILIKKRLCRAQVPSTTAAGHPFLCDHSVYLLVSEEGPFYVEACPVNGTPT